MTLTVRTRLRSPSLTPCPTPTLLSRSSSPSTSGGIPLPGYEEGDFSSSSRKGPGPKDRIVMEVALNKGFVLFIWIHFSGYERSEKPCREGFRTTKQKKCTEVAKFMLKPCFSKERFPEGLHVVWAEPTLVGGVGCGCGCVFLFFWNPGNVLWPLITCSKKYF